jgi:hypothetical protein
MASPNEIKALFSLLDDPDEEVFFTVEKHIISYGDTIIPNLENLWENTLSEAVQERIELIIHRIHFEGLKKEILTWQKGDQDLLHGSLLIAKFQYPELQAIKIIQEVEKMRRNLWLEMNNFITPIEQVKIFESILYNYYKLTSQEISYENCDDFMLHKVIERKKGNALSNGILYLILAEKLDLPIRFIRIPNQFVLGYFMEQSLFNQTYHEGNAAGHIKFFIDPNSGIGFSHKDIDQYYTRVNIKPANNHFKPLSKTKVLCWLATEFANCFSKPELQYKKNELLELANLLSG